MPVDQVEGRETLAELPLLAAERFAGRPAQRFSLNGDWQDLSFTGLRDMTVEIALGLIAHHPQGQAAIVAVKYAQIFDQLYDKPTG